jgi:hypothetical protein
VEVLHGLARAYDLADEDNDHSDQEMDADDLRDFEDEYPDVQPRPTVNIGSYT